MSEAHDIDRTLAQLPLPDPQLQGECPDEGLLIAYRRQALEAEAAAAVERHLLGCNECRALSVELVRPVSEQLYARLEAQVLPAARAGRRRRRGAGPAGGLRAAAAAILLMLRPPSGPAELPAYELEGPLGGLKVHRRSDEVPSATFLPHSRLKILLRPANPAPEPSLPLALRAFVARPGGPLRPVPAGAVSGGQGGAFRLEASAAALFGDQPGVWLVHLALGQRVEDLDGGAGARVATLRALVARGGVLWKQVEVKYRLQANHPPDVPKEGSP